MTDTTARRIDNFRKLELDQIERGTDIGVIATKCGACDTYRMVEFGRVEEVLHFTDGGGVKEITVRPWRSKENGFAPERNRFTREQLRDMWLVPGSDAADILLPSMVREQNDPCIHDTNPRLLFMSDLGESVEAAVVRLACGNCQTHVVMAQGAVTIRENNADGDLEVLYLGSGDVTADELLHMDTTVIPLVDLEKLLASQGSCYCP